MTLSLNVLNHLGINLYSNVAAVLSEVVANAWDADATLVEIDIDKSAGRITITDNGIGMTTKEVNDRFLTVGYQRRQDKTIPAAQRAKTAKRLSRLFVLVDHGVCGWVSRRRRSRLCAAHTNPFVTWGSRS